MSSLNKKMNDYLGSNKTNSIMPNIVFSLFEDVDKSLWIGTLGNGLYKYNSKQDVFKRFTINNGLIHETVFSLSQGN